MTFDLCLLHRLSRAPEVDGEVLRRSSTAAAFPSFFGWGGEQQPTLGRKPVRTEVADGTGQSGQSGQ